MKMADAQEIFELKPRVTPKSSRKELEAHIRACHNRLLKYSLHKQENR